MNPVFKFDSSDPEFNTIYAHELNRYLSEGVEWSAAPFKNAFLADMQQFGADSFAAGWLAYRSQATQLLKNALPWLHLYAHQAKTGYDLNKVNQEIKNITEFLDINQPNPWKTPYGCPKPDAPQKTQTLVQELTSIINLRSLENGSNTPDFILADFLSRCLVAFDDATNARATWYGKKDTAFNKAAGASVSPEENKAAQLRDLHKTPYGANLGKNGPEIVAGLRFANVHMSGFTFTVLNVDKDKNNLVAQIYPPESHGVHPWTEDWNLEHTRWGFERGEYWEIKEPINEELAKKRQFPAGGVIDGMRKQAGREIMSDIENKTAETLHSFKKEYEYITADLLEEFNKTKLQLAELCENGEMQTQEYKDLQKQANELATCINKVKKEAIEKEAAEGMALTAAHVKAVTNAFIKAAKSIKIFTDESREADAILVKLGQYKAAASNKEPITDKTGFLFLRNKGVEWLFHDGRRYLSCEWDGSEWVGWQVSEKFALEAAETQLPAFLEQFVRSHYPTK